jgi:biotin carboxyl carrier protein
VADHDDVAPERTPEERRTDHAAIDRLADELLPALVAKLGASGLGELDVREGRWRVRLRMPGDGRAARRAANPGRAVARPEGHAPGSGHAASGPAAPAPGVPASRTPGPAAPPSDDRSSAPLVPPVLLEPDGTVADATPAPDAAPTRAVATSPAVGFFQPLPGLATGARVRAGDRLGTIDVLGVPYELVAPTDGILGASLVEPGEPVEYGQPVVELELLDAPAGGRAEDA